MFRLTENQLFEFSKHLKMFSKKLLQIAYRLVLCQESKNKHGGDATPHIHGYIEMDGNKTDKQNIDKLRNIIKPFTASKTNYSIQQIAKDDEKSTLSYVTKQQDYVEEYNTSYTPEQLIEHYKLKQKQQTEMNKTKTKDFKTLLCKKFMETSNVTTMRDIKIWVARQLIEDDKLPVMSKVRAYTMFLIHKCDIKTVFDEEIEKLL